jgi:hypothetical protein
VVVINLDSCHCTMVTHTINAQELDFVINCLDKAVRLWTDCFRRTNWAKQYCVFTRTGETCDVPLTAFQLYYKSSVAYSRDGLCRGPDWLSEEITRESEKSHQLCSFYFCS